MIIKTNNHERDILYWWNLTDKERANLEYVGTQVQCDEFQAFRYRGEIYDLREFERTDIEGWHGEQAESYFSAVLVKYNKDYDGVIVGYAYW